VKNRFQSLPFKCNLQRYNVLPQAVLAFLRLHEEALTRSIGGGDGGDGGGGGGGVMDAVDECAAGQFMMDDVVAAAVEGVGEAREDHAWLRMRSAARAAVATRASGVGSLRELTAAFRERSAAEEGEVASSSSGGVTREGEVACSSPGGVITREEFDGMVCAAYPPESELGTAAAAAAVTRAFEEAAQRNKNRANNSQGSSGSGSGGSGIGSRSGGGGGSLDDCHGASYEGFLVGPYKVHAAETHSLQAPGFLNPREPKK
jgi:hypothetical protein